MSRKSRPAPPAQAATFVLEISPALPETFPEWLQLTSSGDSFREAHDPTTAFGPEHTLELRFKRARE
jgi:hypothetical protein